jgi:hypothetical protein
MKYIDNIRILFVRGYLLIGISFLTGYTVIIRSLIYGTAGSILTDPTDPRIGHGYRYMEPEIFSRYYRANHIILLIAFWSGVIGVGLYLWWKKHSIRSNNF